MNLDGPAVHVLNDMTRWSPLVRVPALYGCWYTTDKLAPSWPRDERCPSVNYRTKSIEFNVDSTNGGFIPGADQHGCWQAS
jgi:hypothetical protein